MDECHFEQLWYQWVQSWCCFELLGSVGTTVLQCLMHVATRCIARFKQIQSGLCSVHIAPNLLHCRCCFTQIWNRMRSTVLMQNQHTRELISTWKTSHTHNNRGLSTVTLAWHVHKYKVHEHHHCYRQIRSLLSCWCDTFRALINSLVLFLLFCAYIV